MKDIVILGTSGMAKETAFLIDDINRVKETWNFLGYLTNDLTLVGKNNGKYKIIQHDDWLQTYTKTLSVVIGIGTPSLISVLSNMLIEIKNLSFPNLIHPNVVGDWDRIELGIGNIITAGNIFTTDIKIGSFNIFNRNSTIGHDSSIEDCNVINPNATISGGVKIGNNCLIGTGAQILQYLTVESNTILGAGAVATKDIPGDCTAVGIPAKIISENNG